MYISCASEFTLFVLISRICQKTRSSLVQIMACCSAPSHYPNQCWLIVIGPLETSLKLHKMQFSYIKMNFIIQCTPDISLLCISWNWIYRGHMLDPIFLPSFFAKFCRRGAQKHDIFREIAASPRTQFAGDNFSRNLLTAMAFVPVGRRQFFAKSTRAYLVMGLEHMLCDGQPC